jgi:hypothetical protein
VWPMMTKGGRTGKHGRRSGSALTEGLGNTQPALPRVDRCWSTLRTGLLTTGASRSAQTRVDVRVFQPPQPGVGCRASAATAAARRTD